jgi:hypothetical protein
MNNHKDNSDIIYRMIGAMIMGASALMVLSLILFFLVGCRQMPVLKGEFHDKHAEQARIDSKQSDAIASAFDISYGMNGILFQVVPEDAKPAVKQLDAKIINQKAKADMQAELGRERADLAERDLAAVNAAPDAGAWLSGIAGMFSGNFSGIIELLMGALGVGGLAQAARMKSRSQRMAEKAEMLAGMDPEMAKKLVAVDEDISRHRKAKKS